MSTRIHERGIIVGGIALMLAVFAVDLLLPLPYEIGVVYVLAIVLGLWVRSPRYPFAAAALAQLLLIADTVIGWHGTPAASIYVNRPLDTLLFWATAALVMRFRRLEDRASAHVTRLQELTNALDQAAIVATTDVSGRITFINDKFCEISKYSRDELIGQDHRIINSGLHPKEFMRDLWHTIVPFRNSAGKPYQYVAIRHDITERKLAEERLRHQESLARVGQLAAMVAHEVKNPLAGIKGVLQVLMSRRAPGNPEVDVMHDIIDRIDALNELISDLLVFSRPRPPKMQAIELRPLLVEAINMVRKDPVGERITAEIEGPDIALTGDSTMLRAVFTNLVINAAQAMQGSGAIHLRLATNDDGCTIVVEDTGPGIPIEIRDKIFEPFFTTKSRGGGLGLAITRRSVELHGGSVQVECPPEGGTRVTVALPLHPAPTAAVA